MEGGSSAGIIFKTTEPIVDYDYCEVVGTPLPPIAVLESQ